MMSNLILMLYGIALVGIGAVLMHRFESMKHVHKKQLPPVPYMVFTLACLLLGGTFVVVALLSTVSGRP